VVSVGETAVGSVAVEMEVAATVAATEVGGKAAAMEAATEAVVAVVVAKVAVAMRVATTAEALRAGMHLMTTQPGTQCRAIPPSALSPPQQAMQTVAYASSVWYP
jgi:hypothetical protein